MLVSMLAAGAGVVPKLPRLPVPKPKGYGTHLSKSERRGKTHDELQAMREAARGEETARLNVYDGCCAALEKAIEEMRKEAPRSTDWAEKRARRGTT